ncbi:hypothetical protein X275_01255 [Marinitoga sp. 1197]|uniref:hypothetical protein n=1 Tax=Marinitoga sp. 1197 TaxID=1428449 RepID=UPI00064110DF|nr:hypothetical protein [Marinitoga sp. 1197]AJW76900.1 hypothetical protein UF08_11 [Marinitoga camini virus 1]KLO24048.1 hypothetical protein X275_01255 [Marinitoga sp. 1197]
MDKFINFFIQNKTSILISIITFILGMIINGFWNIIKNSINNFIANIFRSKSSYHRALKSNMNLAIKEIQKMSFFDTKPNDVKVKLIENGDPDVDYEGEQIIFKISKNKKISENVKILFKGYAREYILGRIKIYLNNHQKDSSEDYIAKTLCHLARQKRVEEKIHDEINLKARKQEYKKYIDKYSNIRKNGLLFSIFFPEIKRMGKLSPDGYFEEINFEKEFDEFLNFLYDIATKDHGERVNLKYKSDFSKIAIILVASDNTWEKGKAKPYIERIKKLIKNNFTTIYLISGGYKNEYSSKVFREIKKEIKEISSYPKKEIKVSNHNTIRIYKLDVII